MLQPISDNTIFTSLTKRKRETSNIVLFSDMLLPHLCHKRYQITPFSHLWPNQTKPNRNIKQKPNNKTCLYLALSSFNTFLYYRVDCERNTTVCSWICHLYTWHSWFYIKLLMQYIRLLHIPTSVYTFILHVVTSLKTLY